MNYQVTINKIEGSQLEIKGELAAADFETFWPTVVKKLTTQAEIPGFRKGHAPEKIVVEKVGEDKVLYDMAEEALQVIYPKIVSEHKIEAIGRPDIAITKLAKGNPLGFTIKTAIVPEFKLPDYKKIAGDINQKQTNDNPEVTDQEIEEFVTNLQKMHARQNTESEGKTSGGDNESKLPELTDEYVKNFGDFKSVADFKSKIKEQLQSDKKQKAKEKTRVTILEAIADQTKFDLPEVLVENELHKMLHELQSQVEQMGLKFDDYLKHLQKSPADLQSGWRTDAEKRVKIGLVIQKIIDDAKITIPEKELEDYSQMILKRYAGNTQVNEVQIRNYAENVLLNEKVMELLEKSGK